MNNYIIDLFDLPDDLLEITNVNQSLINSTRVHVVSAKTIRKDFYTCDKCGGYSYHKVKDLYHTKIKLSTILNRPVILKLTKRRFTCDDCFKTFTEPIPFIDKGCFISNKIKSSISENLLINITNSDNALKHFVSTSTVARFLYKNWSNHDKGINFNYLPKAIGFDEFKSTEDCYEKMAFIIVDHDNKTPLYVLPSRRSDFLITHFLKYPEKVRNNVEIVTIDMYQPYINVIKKVFLNAQIVFDKFHIVNNMSRSLNKSRINYMNTQDSTSIEYKKSKKYWRLILSRKDYDPTNYKSFPYYEGLVNTRAVINDIVNQDEHLKNNYKCYQLFFTHLENHNYEDAYDILDNYYESVSENMQSVINQMKENKEYIINAYKYPYSNARTESFIQKIKLIKFQAFGFNNYESFRKRIMLYFDLRLIKSRMKTTLKLTSL